MLALRYWLANLLLRRTDRRVVERQLVDRYETALARSQQFVDKSGHLLGRAYHAGRKLRRLLAY